MNRTTIKKIVGTIGLVVGAVATWLLDPDHHASLVTLLPKHGNEIATVTAWASLAATLWGKHIGSSPSVADALKDGHLATEVEKVSG